MTLIKKKVSIFEENIVYYLLKLVVWDILTAGTTVLDAVLASQKAVSVLYTKNSKNLL